MIVRKTHLGCLEIPSYFSFIHIPIININFFKGGPVGEGTKGSESVKAPDK